MTTLEKAKRNIQEKGFLDIETQKSVDYVKEIKKLRKKKNAIILAHYYDLKVRLPFLYLYGQYCYHEDTLSLE